MSKIARLIRAAVRPLATTEGRKRSLVLLVALPLTASFALGAGLGALAELHGWSALALVAVGILILLTSAIAGGRLLATAQSIQRRHAVSWMPEKLQPLRLEISSEAPQRINIIHPSVDLKHFFGGFIAVFNLARRLAERGHRLRLIATEPSDLPTDWRKRISGYEGLAEVLDRIEVVFAHKRQTIEMHPNDGLIATHWTVAHIAHQATAHLQHKMFVYLIQEYEPFIFPLGSEAALARQSYDLPHFAVFSTELLREYFATHKIGVFSPERADSRDSVVFDNAITPVGPVGETDLQRPGPKRLLFYARPEQHAQRNLFGLGSMALDQALAAGAFAGWRLTGVGSVEPGTDSLHLPKSGATVEMIPRRSQSEYATLLRSSDVGLALMYTPHPSLVPIEMASAGMITVTNTYGNKDALSLKKISPNLIAAEPTVDSIAAALSEATKRSLDLKSRVSGARLGWPDNWDEALNESVMRSIESFLAGE